jgi:trk system potassium uptake protein TrkH
VRPVLRAVFRGDLVSVGDLMKSSSNLPIISYYTGYVVIGTALLMLIPLATALIMREWNPALDFLISTSVSTLIGIVMIRAGKSTRDMQNALKWKHGFVIAALSWVVLMVLCSVPYLLSGHYLSLLDACFDVMSGFTTTGLALIQDMDHISVSLNMWRHILTFVGGQGMVVLALTFLFKNTGGAYKVYVGEAKDIELVPNVKGTARQIWKISLIYLVIGTLALWITGMIIGFKPVSGFFHALFMFASSWSTGGFAPNSQNIMYYHSFVYEIITLVFFILGSLNFGLHYAVWQRNKRELVKNIEVQSFSISVFITSALAVIILAKSGLYTEAVSSFRHVVYNVLSAHTTTGLGTVYTRQFANEWGDKGVLILIVVMLIGASACSTAGGIKGLRVGIIVKGIIADVRKILSSERSVRVYKIHHIKDIILEDSTVKTASLIAVCYLVVFGVGTLLAVFCGYPLLEASFEAASVTGNVGLSIGVTSASMPAIMKIYYIIAMYLGRLEFLSVFALIGFVIGGIKKRWFKKA